MGSAAKYVLVVEDDDLIRDLLELALTEADYSVATASGGVQALESMRTRLPDLLLLDLMMPDMNGWELLRHMAMSRDLAAIPVLVVSAAGANALRQAQDLGAPVFLPKPFNIEDLLLAVEQLTTAPTRQCAWCGQVATASGDFALHSGRTLAWATHGVCPDCKRREIDRILRETH
ncbi:MAG: response regulator [Chloroflexi bacterium]|nr:response regulator [Chloroflexota bacterium]MBV9895514.1 response regulator [Chloroflexota bacterium]